MIKIIQLAFLAALMLTGCSRQMPKVGAATFNVSDGNTSKQTSYQLLPDGQKLLESVLARKPDSTHDGSVELLVTGLLILDEQRYAIEPDEIVFLGDNRTRIWRHIGIREDLIKKSHKLKE